MSKQTLSILYNKFIKDSDKPEKVFINGDLSVRYGDQVPTKLRFITHDDKVYLVCTGDDGFQTQFEIPISKRKFVKKEKKEGEQKEGEEQKERGEKPRKQRNYRERRNPKEKQEESSEKKESSEN